MKTIFKLAAMSFLLTAFTFSNVNAQFTVAGATPGALNTSYTSLTNAGGVFAALNTATSGIITVDVNASSLGETGAISLNATGVWTSVTISPSGGAWTISGTVAGAPMINLNGADNVTFNGLNTGGNSLTISNLSTSATTLTSTIRFINGASNNTITNCTVLGSYSGPVGTNGGNIFFHTDAAGGNGNDNNTISNCDIGPAGVNTPSKLIYGSGSNTTATIRNSGISIDNNNLFDCFRPTVSSSSIYMTNGNDLWTINNNRFYQTATRTFTATGQQFSAIFINHTTAPMGSFTITNNIIGYASSTQTGTTTITGTGVGLANFVRPIWLASVSNTVVTSIQGNTISGMDVTSSQTGGAFLGISSGVGTSFNGLVNVGNIAGNTIGSVSSTPGNSTIVINSNALAASLPFPVIGIFNQSDFSTNTSNNLIGNITINQVLAVGTGMGFFGIFINTLTTVSATLNDNEIALITNNHPGDNSTYGIYVTPATSIIVHNTIRDMISNGIGLNIIHNAGILVSGPTNTGVNNIEKNNIHNLKNTGNIAGAIYGILVSVPVNTNTVKQNFVYALDAVTTSPAYSLVGIGKQGALGTATVFNNMITLGLKADGSPITSPLSIRGIEDLLGGPTNYYYNSVYITGSGVNAGLANSFCMFSSSIVLREFKNNIFWNDRSNTTGGGPNHYAVAYAGVAIDPLLTSNYNDLAATGTDGFVGLYNVVPLSTLAAWQLATGQDANSSSVTVNFLLPSSGILDLTGASIGDLNLTATPIPGITTDIYKNLRHDTPPLTPYMGAHEPQNALPVELASFSSTVSGRDAVLNWATTSEVNNQGFDIERATDGVWTKVGSVNGNGTTNETHNYSYTDRALNNGTYNYRLKQIDFNGHFEYFNLINEVVIGVPSDYNLAQNYPNPFNPTTKINYDLPFDSRVSIKLFDMSGREVATLVNENISAGYHSINFNGANLSSGTYFYKIVADANGNNFTSVKKMVLIK